MSIVVQSTETATTIRVQPIHLRIQQEPTRLQQGRKHLQHEAINLPATTTTLRTTVLVRTAVTPLLVPTTEVLLRGQVRAAVAVADHDNKFGS